MGVGDRNGQTVRQADRQAGRQAGRQTDRGEREEGGGGGGGEESKNTRMLIHVYKQQAVPGGEREEMFRMRRKTFQFAGRN